MSRVLGSALDAARVRSFVGRRADLDAFDTAIAGCGTHRVLFVHGPGGIGKTTLLQQFRIRAGRSVVELDARDIDCSPEGFVAAYDQATAATAAQSIVLLDGYERLAALDDWLRSVFLPALPADSVVVLAGREPPTSPWRTDPGWRELCTVRTLGVLPRSDSVALLARLAVPGEQRERLAALGRGHPLTLALLADSAVTTQVPDDLADAPDLVAALVTQIVGDAPDEAHALGYALSAAAWLTTEDLLRCTVGDRATEVWTWLASRPFITVGPEGLYPHDLVRDVLDADLRRRSPERYRRVHHIVHRQAVAGLRAADTSRHGLWGHQKLYLHRKSPLSGSFWVLRERGAAAVVPGRPTDHPEILDLVRRFDGDLNAAIAANWLDAQPEGISVVRSPTGISGFVLQVLFPTDPALIDADPVVRAAIDLATTESPARPGEQISVGRFLSGRTRHQRDDYAVLAASVSSAILWISRPLAWSFVATVDPEFWGPCFDYLGLTRRFRTDFDGRAYTIYGIDWRRITVDRWLDVMADRELTGDRGPIPSEFLRPAPLSRPQFDDAVRLALRDFARPELLGRNPLITSRLVADRTGDPAAALRAAILGGIQRVGQRQRQFRLDAVLDRTFVRPAPNQEAAAEVLELPFSTYRRHLARAVNELIDVLWAVEIGQLPAVSN